MCFPLVFKISSSTLYLEQQFYCKKVLLDYITSAFFHIPPELQPRSVTVSAHHDTSIIIHQVWFDKNVTYIISKELFQQKKTWDVWLTVFLLFLNAGCLTQVKYVDHGLHPQCVIQRHHCHGVSVAGQLWDHPLSPAEGDKATLLDSCPLFTHYSCQVRYLHIRDLQIMIYIVMHLIFICVWEYIKVLLSIFADKI